MHSNDDTARLKAMRYRAWHRGTREADCLIGGFFERDHAAWDGSQVAWFEALLDAEDHDILAWALGTAAAPARFAGPMLAALQALDYAAPAR